MTEASDIEFRGQRVECVSGKKSLFGPRHTTSESVLTWLAKNSKVSSFQVWSLYVSFYCVCMSVTSIIMRMITKSMSSICCISENSCFHHGLFQIQFPCCRFSLLTAAETTSASKEDIIFSHFLIVHFFLVSNNVKASHHN